MADVQIGQTLYEPHPRYSGEYIEHKVEKIGRKWIALRYGGRCTLDGLRLDCHPYGSRQLYADKEAHRSEFALKAAWRDLNRDLGRTKMPAEVTIETIAAARRLLGLEVLEVSDARQ